MVSSRSGQCNLIHRSLWGGKAQEQSREKARPGRPQSSNASSQKQEFITRRWKHWWWRFIQTPHIHHSVSTSETAHLHPSSFLSTSWIFTSSTQTFQQSADSVVKRYCSKLFAENNTSHFRWMAVRVRPVVHDFLSPSAGSGVSSPDFRGLSIWVCSTAQGNYWRGQTEGSAGNNNMEQIMTQ